MTNKELAELIQKTDRIYICECGYTADRDYNASLNLRDCQTYKIA